MAQVSTPVEGYSGLVAGVVFVDGRGETDDANALAYFARHGYVVSEPEPSEPSESWTVAALEAWAQTHDVDLGDAKKKADILAAIAAASEAAGDA